MATIRSCGGRPKKGSQIEGPNKGSQIKVGQTTITSFFSKVKAQLRPETDGRHERATRPDSKKRHPLSMSERRERNEQIAKILDSFPHVKSHAFRRGNPSGTQRGIFVHIVLDTKEELYVPEGTLLKGTTPKVIRKLIQEDDARSKASEFLDNIQFVMKKNGSGDSNFITGNLKCNGLYYEAVVGRIIKGMIPRAHAVWTENIRWKEKLESEGYTDIEMDVLATDPSIELKYKGLACRTSLRSVRQGSRPNIVKFSGNYLECMEEAEAEGFTGLEIKTKKVQSGKVAFIHLQKHDLDVWYEVSSFLRGHRPFNHGPYCDLYFERHPDMKCVSATLYHVEFSCKTSDDCFHKYGITRNKKVHKRFSNDLSNYSLTIISTLRTTLYDAYQKEQGLLQGVSHLQYYPTLKLGGGNTECFKPDHSFVDHLLAFTSALAFFDEDDDDCTDDSEICCDEDELVELDLCIEDDSQTERKCV